MSRKERKFVMYNYENWELRGTLEDIKELEEAERMVISDEALISAYFSAKQERASRLAQKKTHKPMDRVKNRSYQKICDSYKRNCQKKDYSLKYKGETRKDSRIVPSNALGWNKINLSIMGTKVHGVKVGAIWDMT